MTRYLHSPVTTAHWWCISQFCNQAKFAKLVQSWAGKFAIFTLCHRFYVKSNMAISGDTKLQFWSFQRSQILIFEKIPHLKMLEMSKFSLCDIQILRKIKFGNFRGSKSAILVILEGLNFDFWENPTFESVKDDKNPKTLKIVN